MWAQTGKMEVYPHMNLRKPLLLNKLIQAREVLGSSFPPFLLGTAPEASKMGGGLAKAANSLSNGKLTARTPFPHGAYL